MSYRLIYAFPGDALPALAAVRTGDVSGTPLLKVPAGAKLDWATLEINERWAHIEYGYFGVKKNGQLNTRRTTGSVHLGGPNWVTFILPGAPANLRLAAQTLWPHP